MKKISSNKNLHSAGKAKSDEFYTQLSDIEKELGNYKNHLKNKVIFCNCDDPEESHFWKYFAENFEHLGLKKLISTHYKDANLFTNELPYKLEYTGDKNGNRMPDPSEFMVKMIGTGDFRSEECIELLKETDIVVTNPPFSLFREYIVQLSEYDKKFLIIGNTNAVKYNKIFKLIKDNKLRTGYTNFNVGMFFVVPNNWEKFHHINEGGKKIARVSTACWFTNLDVYRHHELITLYKKYTPEEYPKYDNYEAINVNKYTDIPVDYDGVIGVPITFLDKYNPTQFEILGIFDDKREKSDAFIQGIPTYVDEQHKKYVGPVLNGSALYTRVLIKNRKVKK
ncbi:MAG: adenine-specific methyltransferase EcoRI family protein [bacterium]|nr:adenine-specific methyltransferase EcoRI family protein [bacterium]